MNYTVNWLEDNSPKINFKYDRQIRQVNDTIRLKKYKSLVEFLISKLEVYQVS